MDQVVEVVSKKVIVLSKIILKIITRSLVTILISISYLLM